MVRFFKIFLNVSQRNLLKNLVILCKIWRKIGPIGILNGSLFLAKLVFVCVCCMLSNSAAAYPYQNQTWVPLRITDQLWAYWGNVYMVPVLFFTLIPLNLLNPPLFRVRGVDQYSGQVWKKKKKVSLSHNGLSLSERESVVVNEDVTFARWPPWDFCMA